MTTHLITGGNGFVGTFLCEYILKKNEKVIVVDIIEDPKTDKRAKFIKCDITNFEEFNKILRENYVDYVYHSAALVPIKKSGDKFREVNVKGTENVANSAIQNRIKHFVHISSSAVFGNVTKGDCPISRSPSNLKPIEIYGKSKFDAENLIKKFINLDNQGTTFSIIRPRTIIGTKRLGIFEILFEWINEGRNIYIIGKGNNIFQFIHVEDLCDAIYKSAIKSKNNIYNVGSTNFYSLKETLDFLCESSGTGSVVKPLPENLVISILKFLDFVGLSPLAPWHYLTYHKDYFFDVSHTMNELKWYPKYDDKTMIKESYNWYLNNKDNLLSKGSAHKSKIKQKFIKVLKYLS